MLYQSPVSSKDSSPMQARLQKAGVPFNKAMSVAKSDLRKAAESQEAFDRLVQRLSAKRT